jgi:flagellar hook-associated protein 3 FlgL
MTMSISGVNTTTAIMVKQLTSLRSQLDDLQRQIATGQKVDTYAGISSQAQLIVGLNSQLSSISNFQSSNNIVSARLAIAQTTLTQFDSVTTTVRNSAQMSTFQASANGQTADQTYATAQLDQLLNLLNTQADGRYLFSGAAVDKQSVASKDEILNGVGNKAGLKQVISERNQADLGLSGLGRLVIPPSGGARVNGTGGSIPAASVTGSVSISPPYASAGGTMVIDGTTVTIPAKSDSTAVVNAINSALAGVTASLDGGGHLVLTNQDATKPLSVAATSPAVGDVFTEFGIPAATTQPPDLIAAGVVNAGDTLTIQVGPSAANMLTLTFGSGPGQVDNLGEVSSALQSLTGGMASVDASGNISVAALSTGEDITIGGTASAASLARFGLAAGTTTPLPGGGTRVSVTEDAIGSPFGFKLTAASVSPVGGAVAITSPAGSPKGVTISVNALPIAGDTLTINVALPDGTSGSVTLKATTSTLPAPGQYTIGADQATTAANIQGALTASFKTLAATDLTAASAITASRNFFDIDATHAAQRVAGPPYATATALQDGTSADTVTWYKGAMASDARNSVTARIDSTATVGYGVQANEAALRTAVENIAVFAATTFSVSNTNSGAAYVSLARRVGVNLNAQTGDGTQKTSDIETELANAQTSIKSMTEQQSQKQVTLQNFVQGITGITNEEVAAQFLAIQTQLQASLQTTAMLSKLTLTNYIS